VRRIATFVVVAAAVAGGLVAPGARAAGECSGLPQCISVAGPWVVVPARGTVEFLLGCPGGKGIVGGTDARVSATAISVSFDAILGSPVSPGRTTDGEVLFRAVADDHRAGEFQPYLGCVPTAGSVRNTTGVLPVGPALDLHATSITAAPGGAHRGAVGCSQGEQLVDSWTATAFATAAPTAPALAAAIAVRSGIRDGVAAASVVARRGLPAAAHALVQLGVRCTGG
jgi:hypothetical protein